MSKAKNKRKNQATIENRKARHDFHVLETFEAGMELKGTEVKSLRQGKANLQDSYAEVTNGEMFLVNMHISPYKEGNRHNEEPRRKRKLLMHKREILRLLGQTKQEGLTIIPLRIYFTRGMAKVLLGLAKGKKQHDKREDAAKRSAQREMDKAMKDTRLSNF